MRRCAVCGSPLPSDGHDRYEWGLVPVVTCPAFPADRAPVAIDVVYSDLMRLLVDQALAGDVPWE